MSELATIELAVERELGNTLPKEEARGIAQEFLLRNMKDTLTARLPSLLIVEGSLVWRVPIVFARPDRTFGEVGEVLISASTGEVKGWSPSEEVYRIARGLLAS